VDNDGTGWMVELDEDPPVANTQPQLGTAGELTEPAAVRVGRNPIQRCLDTTLNLRVEPSHLSSRGGCDDYNPAAIQENS
jgi:hypothetical protein